MYAQPNQNLPQYLADFIQQNANAGPVQQYVWQLATQNTYNNEFFQRMVSTLTEVLQMWSAGGQQADINQAISTVYYCTCGMTATRYPDLAQRMSQADYNAWLQWAQEAQGLSNQINQWQAQANARYAAPAYNTSIPAPRGAPQPRPQANGWDAVPYAGAPAQAPGYPSNNNAAFAVPGQPAGANPRQAAAAPVGNNYQPRSGGRYSGPAHQEPAQSRPNPVLRAAESQTPQFMKVREGGWRSRSNTSTGGRFNPEDPQHAPVGREVAEQHEAAATAAGSWESSNFEWDDPKVSFDDEFEQPKSQVQGNASGTPQFMERISSNPDVPALIFGKETADGYMEFTIEDWRTKPDPDFPWEIGYTPATRTRRIAYDTKRQCFIQCIEENSVNYDDHAILQKSAAVSSTVSSRAHEKNNGRRNMFDPATAAVHTLGELVEGRQKIIDGRLEAAKETWELQEEQAREKAKDGVAYVAPELEPSREDAMATATPNESDAEKKLVLGKLAAEQIVNVDLADGVFFSEQHALYSAQSTLVNDNFDASDVPLLVTRYVETTPYLVEKDAEDVIETLTPFTKQSQLKSMVDMAKELERIAGDIPADLWAAIDGQITEYVNSVLTTELGLEVTITSFAEDGAALPEYLKTNKGEKFLQALSRNIAEFMAPLRCISVRKDDAGEYGPAVEQTVLLRRETTLARLNYTSTELGVFADKPEFVITETSAPTVYNLVSTIMKATLREDGKAGFFKRVLILADGTRFTIHQGWMGDGKVIILKR